MVDQEDKQDKLLSQIDNNNERRRETETIKTNAKISEQRGISIRIVGDAVICICTHFAEQGFKALTITTAHYTNRVENIQKGFPYYRVFHLLTDYK